MITYSNRKIYSTMKHLIRWMSRDFSGNFCIYFHWNRMNEKDVNVISTNRAFVYKIYDLWHQNA